jgi:hypothetical protein
MSFSTNTLLSSLSTSDFDLLAPRLEAVTPRVAEDARKAQPEDRGRLFSRDGLRVRRRRSTQRQGSRGRIDRPRRDDRAADRARQPPLSPRHLYPGARKGSLPSGGAVASLRDSLLKFVQAFGVQTAHTAICNAQSKLDERLARWLLMAQDRVQGDILPLTHEFLSVMLGVRRPGVTVALEALRERGLISYRRGEITIKDRKGIAGVAGDAYGTPESEYRRLIG